MDKPISEIVEIYNCTKQFHDEHIDGWGYPWDDNMKLPDIIKFSHGKWISFKNISKNGRSAILNGLVNAPNIEISKRIVGKILLIYKSILDFIQERRTNTPEEKVDHWSPEGIALELRQVLAESILTISEIMGEEPCINQKITDIRQGESNPCGFNTNKAKALLRGLAKAGLVEKRGDSFTWLKSASLYGYFVDVSSTYLSLRSSNNRIPWSKYELLFTNHSKMLSTARSGVNDYTNGRQVKPEGYEIIQTLCEP